MVAKIGVDTAENEPSQVPELLLRDAELALEFIHPVTGLECASE